MSVVTGPDNSAEERISQMIFENEKDLLRLCCVYLKDVALAQDAVQETFLKAYKHLHTFRNESSSRTWLIRIAINVCKDMRRTSWFRIAKNAVALDRLQLVQPQGDHEIRSLLVSQIMALPVRCREAVLLYYYEGFTLAQIADALHVSVATVHRRLEKARSLLKNALKGGDADETR